MDNIDFAFGNGGWMERALTVAQQTAPVSAMTISKRSAPALRGKNGGVAFDSLERFRRSSRELAAMRPALESMYGASGDPLATPAIIDAFSAVDTLSGVSPARGANYPNGKLAAQLREAAALIKADIGVRMIAINYGGWDHHSNESDRMKNVGAQLTDSLAAFQADLGGAQPRVMTVVMSEFGRTAKENGSGGTDHGHGSLMTILGGGLASGGGGRVHLRNNQWVGLANDQLIRNRNLAVSTDFRAVLSEVLTSHMGIVDDGRIFPGYTPESVGLFASDPTAPQTASTNGPPATSATDLALRSGVQQTATSGGMGLAKIVSAASATTAAAGAVVAGLLWRKRPQPDPLVPLDGKPRTITETAVHVPAGTGIRRRKA